MDNNEFYDWLFEEDKNRFSGKDKKALLDLDTLYFDTDINDTGIARNEAGKFLIKIYIGEGYKVIEKDSLGSLELMASMISRLKAFGYPVEDIEFIRENGKNNVKMLTEPKALVKYYADLRKKIEKLQEKYGENLEEHIDELVCTNSMALARKVKKGETREEISSSYEMLKRNFEQYKDTLSEDDRRKLDVALQIYGGSLFISLNRIASIPDYQNKTGAELIAECDKNEDFREYFHGNFKKITRILASSYDGSEKEIIERWGEILDYSSEERLVESMKNVLMIIDSHKDKVVVPEDIYVYRGFANDEPADLMSLSGCDIVSTSLSRRVADGFSNKSGSSGRYRYMNYILVQKGTPYIMPITDLGYEQKEIVFLESAVNLEKVGLSCRDIERSVWARTYVMSPKERIHERDIANENLEDVQGSKIEVETIEVHGSVNSSLNKVRTNETKDDGVR